MVKVRESRFTPAICANSNRYGLIDTGVAESGSVNPEFQRVTAEARFREGEGLSGRAWRQRDLFFTEDVGQMTDCCRAPAAQRAGVKWRRRDYDPTDWGSGDLPNRCLSAATACLYGLSEAAVLAAGYSPAVGFIHTGKPLSFVYDIADIFKFETVAPVAFRIAAQNPPETERAVRHACRDSFRQSGLLKRIIPTIEQVLEAGGLERPQPPPDAIGPAFPEPEGIGDAGHRS